MGTLRGGDELQQFFGIVEPLLELILIGVAQGRGGELRGDAGVFEASIGGDETDFVDTDAAGSGQSGFQLLSEFGRLGFAGGKGVNEAAEFVVGDDGEKLHAGEASGGEKLGELAFRRSAFERHTV